MKKLVFVFAVMLLMVSCDSSKSKLSAMVRAADRQCPVHINDTITCTDVEFSRGTVTYYFAIDEEQYSLDSLDARLDTIAENFKVEFELTEDDEFIDACKGTKAKINYIFKGVQSEDRMGFGLDPTTGQTTIYHLRY